MKTLDNRFHVKFMQLVVKSITSLHLVTSQKGYTIALRLPLVTISVMVCNLLFIV